MDTLTPQQQRLITTYITLLKEYNEQTNIYSKKAYEHLDFHIQDCITLSILISKKAKTLVDMGSGSGLPSIILSIARPDLTITAIESKGRKTRFLQHVQETLSLSNLTVLQDDILHYAHQTKSRPDIITAKAFAPYDKAIEMAQKLARQGTALWIPISEIQYTALSALKETSFTLKSTQDNFFYLHWIK
ncbi:MAG: 16S rRNA (guanine(527)-N(7))-methyltransferase RsmG [Candidatus Margulisbacteria bacterium]|nr:16S rRNA (guanine(527)-N(7))-methyltransferase RsmG [Candidatus Margulisiibacteriota bacterium]